MKKDMSALRFGLPMLVVPTIVMLLLIFGEINISTQMASILLSTCWVLQIWGAIVLGQFFVLKKPHYHFENLKESSSLEIIEIIEEEGNFVGKMIVFIPDFGQTLIFLSSREEDWPGKKIPEKGKVYEKRGDRFVEVIY